MCERGDLNRGPIYKPRGLYRWVASGEFGLFSVESYTTQILLQTQTQTQTRTFDLDSMEEFTETVFRLYHALYLLVNRDRTLMCICRNRKCQGCLPWRCWSRTERLSRNRRQHPAKSFWHESRFVYSGPYSNQYSHFLFFRNWSWWCRTLGRGGPWR